MLIRELQPNESGVLRDFLYEAIFLPEGTKPPERSIVELPELRIYYEGFGEGKADFCMVAEDDGRIVGAVWTRLMKDYGYVDDETPSFAISLYREYRGKGIGTKLMLVMLEKLQEHGFKRASLAVQKANYAVRMYEKVGFRTVSENEEEYIMVCDLTEGIASRVAEEFTKRSRQILGDNLYGAPIDEVFGEVPKKAYMDSIWRDIEEAEDAIAEDTMYLTLNLARVLAFQMDGNVLSKQEGGEWGLKNLPEKYHGLLRDALSEYRGAKPEYDRNAAKEYASEMLQRIRNKEIQASIEPVKGDY